MTTQQEFRARSGRTVRTNEDGSVSFQMGRGYLGPEQSFDAEEFFQAKRDLDLGRWRWPANPDYVVMDAGLGFAKILHEPSMKTTTWERGWRDARSTADEAGVAYFEAHPERKPWHDAKQDGEGAEVWALTLEGVAGEKAYIVDGNRFECGPHSMHRTDPSIVAGRRIWPEDAS